MGGSLYVHIPFCARKCTYCDFFSVPHTDDLAKDYVKALCKELEIKKVLASRLDTVFIGGGTPSVLSEELLSLILTAIGQAYHLSSQAEITVEANPGTLTPGKALTLISLGVTRVSLGVQSFHDKELQLLGRIHTGDEAASSARMLQDAGLKNLSLDLMYGIPGQTLMTWQDSLDRAMACRPQHISAYELTPERETPLQERLDTGELAMPDEDAILALSALAAQRLEKTGFQQYEISNFARKGFRCRHNMNYWDRGEYIGVGAGAHSFLNEFRMRNISSIPEYIDKLRSGILPETEKYHVSRDEQVKEFLMLGLRKMDGLLLSDAENLGLHLTEAAAHVAAKGLIAIERGRLHLTKRGIPLANTVIVSLLDALEL